MESIAGVWHNAARQLEQLIPDLGRVRSETQAVLAGATAQAAAEQFAMLFDGDYAVAKLSGAMRGLGELAAGQGTQIQYTKLQILSTLAIALGAMWRAIAAADFTAG